MILVQNCLVPPSNAALSRLPPFASRSNGFCSACGLVTSASFGFKLGVGATIVPASLVTCFALARFGCATFWCVSAGSGVESEGWLWVGLPKS